MCVYFWVVHRNGVTQAGFGGALGWDVVLGCHVCVYM